MFADPGHAEARELLATALEQLGHGAETGLWRNIYLRGAEELRGPIAPPPPELASPEVLGALTIEQLFDSLSVRIDGLRAAKTTVCIDWIFTDLKHEGDASLIPALLRLLDSVDHQFPIVTP